MVSQIFEASPSSCHERRAENKQKKRRKETVEDAVFPRVSVVAVLSTQAEDSVRGTRRRRRVRYSARLTDRRQIKQKSPKHFTLREAGILGIDPKQEEKTERGGSAGPWICLDDFWRRFKK